jgi:hypothetical protein
MVFCWAKRYITRKNLQIRAGQGLTRTVSSIEVDKVTFSKTPAGQSGTTGRAGRRFLKIAKAFKAPKEITLLQTTEEGPFTIQLWREDGSSTPGVGISNTIPMLTQTGKQEQHRTKARTCRMVIYSSNKILVIPCKNTLQMKDRCLTDMDSRRCFPVPQRKRSRRRRSVDFGVERRKRQEGIRHFFFRSSKDG